MTAGAFPPADERRCPWWRDDGGDKGTQCAAAPGHSGDHYFPPAADELDDLEAIVRELATPRAWVYDYICCAWCGASAHTDGRMDEPHHADCPFGRAVAWVEAHPL